MDSLSKLYMERSENELRLAKALLMLSEDEIIKKQLQAEPADTFYSAVISHAYYAIFYATKALLLTKGIDPKPPEIHKRTYEEFKKEFVDTGILDVELLKIYNEMIVTADELLNIFEREKWKRGHFTYRTIPQANQPFANESVEHARKFLQNIFAIMKK